jgi:hypothetical protein
VANQQFWILLKAATGQKGEDENRAVLKSLSDKDHVRDLDDTTLAAIGRLLRGITANPPQYTLNMNEGAAWITDPQDQVVWPVQPNEPATESQGSEEPPEKMF